MNNAKQNYWQDVMLSLSTGRPIRKIQEGLVERYILKSGDTFLSRKNEIKKRWLGLWL